VIYQTPAGSIGVNTTTPLAGFHAVSGASPTAYFDVYSNALSALPVVYRAARGTPSVPSAVQTNDILGGLAVRGYGATTWSAGRGQVMYKAAENWTDEAQGTYLQFTTTPIGTGTWAERMRIAPDGNVGIGIQAPAQKLSVAGTVESTSGGFKFPDGTTQATAGSGLGANTFTATQTIASGNLALPATSGALSGMLTLDGVAFLHGYGAASNTFLGGQAGGSLAITTGTNNTGVGYSALYATTAGGGNTAVGASSLAANTMGGLNTAVGYSALSANTTGSSNTAIGTSSLMVNTTGGLNTAAGYRAMLANTTGNSNAAFGMGALRANLTGSNNSAFGYAALSAATDAIGNSAFGASSMLMTTTGGSNSAFGQLSLRENTEGVLNGAFGNAALFRNTTGGYNAGFGANALSNNTTGSSNSACGYASLSGNTTASFNAGLGTGSLYSNSTGNENVAVGFNALYTNVVGNGNTAVGSQSGVQVSGSENTFIGHLSGTDIAHGALTNATAIGSHAGVTQDNSIVLGGTGLYAVNVGIGTTAPAQRLSVVGTVESTTGGFRFPDGTVQATAATAFLGANTFTATQTIAAGNLALPSTTDATSGVLTLGGQPFLHGAGATTYPNTYLGSQAGRFGTLGTGGNVGVGGLALGNSPCGEANTAVGYRSLYAANCAVSNVAVGFRSLESNTTGSGNVAVGYLSLSGNTTGGSSVAVGYHSLALASGAEGNVAIGYNSLDSTTTGYFNTAVGNYAGRTNTTGEANTFLGASADATTSGLLGATAIGYGAKVSQNNSLVLGDTMVSVGIGTSAPNTKLQVVGNIRVGTSGTNGCVQRFDGTSIAGTCSSDARLKTEIRPLESVLGRVTDLQPVRFRWRADEYPTRHFGNAVNIGLIAQDVERVFPELVSTDDEGYKLVSTSELPYLTLQAMKELKTKSDRLEAENDALKAQFAALAERLSKLEKR
jgi:hypothetical protein